MSRIFGLTVVLCDVVTTVASFLNSSGILLVAAISLLLSIVMAGTTEALRSILWPNYFWDPAEQAEWVRPEPAPIAGTAPQDHAA